MEHLTFDDICCLEPEIARLFRSVKDHSLGTNPQYLWDNFYRVTLDQLVGPASNVPQLQSSDVHKIVVNNFIEVLGLDHP
jgi:hypothetical protein